METRIIQGKDVGLILAEVAGAMWEQNDDRVVQGLDRIRKQQGRPLTGAELARYTYKFAVGDTLVAQLTGELNVQLVKKKCDDSSS